MRLFSLNADLINIPEPRFVVKITSFDKLSWSCEDVVPVGRRAHRREALMGIRAYIVVSRNYNPKPH